MEFVFYQIIMPLIIFFIIVLILLFQLLIRKKAMPKKYKKFDHQLSEEEDCSYSKHKRSFFQSISKKNWFK